MENASKALIIAGAILIAILLISVGILVLNTVNKPIDQAQTQADAQAIELFNSKFAGYFGKNKSASSAKALITLVNSSNGVDEKHKIYIVHGIRPVQSEPIITIGDVDDINDIVSNHTYTITPVYANSDHPTGGQITQKGYLYLIGIDDEQKP